MYSREVEDKLKQLKIEDFIWVIYIGIIALSYYSNYLERKYYLNNDITLTSEWKVPTGETSLCLNGHKIELGSDITNDTRCVIRVYYSENNNINIDSTNQVNTKANLIEKNLFLFDLVCNYNDN